MILGNVRAQFAISDIKFLIKALWGQKLNKAELVSFLKDESFLLSAIDEPNSYSLMLSNNPPKCTPLFFYYVILRHKLLERGVDNVLVSDYITDLVWSFSFQDRAWRIDKYDDECYIYILDVYNDARQQTGKRAYQLYSHMGNVSVWLLGLFPEYIRYKQSRGAASPALYEALGIRGLKSAAVHPYAQLLGVERHLLAVADNFYEVIFAMNTFKELTAMGTPNTVNIV